jgi:type I restriction enzyme, S subunit
MLKQESNFQYLKFVEFKDLEFWDVKSNFFKSPFLSNFEIVKLGEVIKQRKGSITIDDSQEYKRCRVQLYGKGVVLRDIVKGSTLKVKKQQVCKKDDFLVAEIDAKFGGYGILDSSLENAVVSSHYFLFEVNQEKLDLDFFKIIIKSNNFAKQIEATGSTNYAAIRPYHVLDYKIPLPPIEIQKQLVENYLNKITQAQNNKIRVLELEKHIEDYLMDELGIEIVEKQKQDNGYKYLQFVEFKELDRWDIDFLLRNTDKNISKFNLVKYETIFKSLKNGIADRNYSKTGIKYLTVASIKNGSIKQDTIQYVSQCKDDDFLENGTLLITRKGTIGQSAIIKEDKQYVASSEIFIIKLDNEIINPDYFVIINNLEWTQNQFKIKAGGMTMPSISQPNLKSIEIPLLPLEIQEKIVALIDEWKAEIKELKQAVESLEKEAKEEFENAVFN